MSIITLGTFDAPRALITGQKNTLPISYSIDAFLVSDLVISAPKLLSLQGLRPLVKMLVV